MKAALPILQMVTMRFALHSSVLRTILRKQDGSLLQIGVLSVLWTQTISVFAGLLPIVSSWPRYCGKSWGMSGFARHFIGSFVMSPLTQFLEQQPNGEAITQCIISTGPICHGGIIFNTMPSYSAGWNTANGLLRCIESHFRDSEA